MLMLLLCLCFPILNHIIITVFILFYATALPRHCLDFVPWRVLFTCTTILHDNDVVNAQHVIAIRSLTNSGSGGGYWIVNVRDAMRHNGLSVGRVMTKSVKTNRERFCVTHTGICGRKERRMTGWKILQLTKDGGENRMDEWSEWIVEYKSNEAN